MGLDITAYSKLREVRPLDDDYDYLTEAFFTIPKEFPGAADGIKDQTIYSYGNSMQFRAGSYGGYNAWREWLASLVGTTPEASWRDPKPGPFVELINFSDCNGTIGAEVSAKLAKDFAQYDERAKTADAYDYDRYCMWRKAFEMAADNGAVSFH